MQKKEAIAEKFGIKLISFFPEAYRLDILSDLIGFINSPSDGLWIKKPYDKKSYRSSIIGNI